ncbi:hypothetical protein QBZ16_005331 [Prototheca wickerhamii]|uniref:Uncharacterized protein n=1 Tax=Prototheca wickerhamii TaxID=3111 RepID=A0AAD9IFF7_PROWI|nr:hypothetical protein QBZ16_005331 [Prototheca wickerhamii]
MPELAGVGFTDLGSGVAGTHSAKFSSTTLAAWRAPLFERLAAHAAVAGTPAIVAFSGKRQFAELFPSKHASILLSEHRPASIVPGRQRVLPSGWPLDRRACEVWVLPSTSGAAAMSREERWGPWRALAARLERV